MASALLASHRRSYDSGIVVEDPAHLQHLTAAKRRAVELRRRDRLRGACPAAASFLEALSHRGEPLRAHAERLVRLLDVHGPEALDAALVETLDRGAVSAASVAHLLDQRARARNVPPTSYPEIQDRGQWFLRLYSATRRRKAHRPDAYELRDYVALAEHVLEQTRRSRARWRVGACEGEDRVDLRAAHRHHDQGPSRHPLRPQAVPAGASGLVLDCVVEDGNPADSPSVGRPRRRKIF